MGLLADRGGHAMYAIMLSVHYVVGRVTHSTFRRHSKMANTLCSKDGSDSGHILFPCRAVTLE